MDKADNGSVNNMTSKDIWDIVMNSQANPPAATSEAKEPVGEHLVLLRTPACEGSFADLQEMIHQSVRKFEEFKLQ